MGKDKDYIIHRNVRWPFVGRRSDKHVKLGMERTQHLSGPLVERYPISVLLANAYIQGIYDTAEVALNRHQPSHEDR